MTPAGYPGLLGLVEQLPWRAENTPARPCVAWTVEDRERWLAAISQVLDFVLSPGTFVLSANASDPTLNYREMAAKREAAWTCADCGGRFGECSCVESRP